MARKFARKVLAFAPEKTYGSDAIASGSPGYVLGREVTITPMAGESAALEYDDGSLGNSQEQLTELYVTLEFACDLCASPDRTKPAAWAELARACMRSVSGSGPVSYGLDDNGTASATFYFYMDGGLHALVGARGNLKFTASAKAWPALQFSFTGLYVQPKGIKQPVASFAAWRTPLKVGAENTTAALDGRSLKMISLEYDQGNQVSHEEYVSHEEVLITDYQPSATLVVQADPLGDFNPFYIVQKGLLQTFPLSHGPEGNQVRWTARLQLGRPTYGDQNGILTYSIPIRPLGNSDRFETY